jgi:hypothetical protein
MLQMEKIKICGKNNFELNKQLNIINSIVEIVSIKDTMPNITDTNIWLEICYLKSITY